MERKYSMEDTWDVKKTFIRRNLKWRDSWEDMECMLGRYLRLVLSKQSDRFEYINPSKAEAQAAVFKDPVRTAL